MVSDFRADELTTLREMARDLGSGKRDSAALDAGPDSEVWLMLRVAERDVGILKTPPVFECLLRRGRWSNIEGLIEPFMSDSSGFQWLDDSGEVSLLLSPGGTW
jgi:hypothetical protein